MKPYIVPRLGLDLGTGNTLVVSRNKIVYSEPTMIVADMKSNRVVYSGKDAADRVGRLGAGLELIRPVIRGAIADYAATRFFLNRVFSKAMRPPRILRPMVVAAVPVRPSSVEERALCDAAREAGAGQIYLVPCNLASHVSMTNELNDPRGSLVVDIGAGVTDISVLASNEVIVGRTVEFAGDDLTGVVQRVLEMSFGVEASREEAVQAKIKVGLIPRPGEKLVIRTKTDSGDKVLRHAEIPQEKVAEFMTDNLKPVFDGIQATLEETPPELYEDIFFRGLFLTGGSSRLRGLAGLIENRFELKVVVPDDPEMSVIRGIGKIISDFPKFREYFSHQVSF